MFILSQKTLWQKMGTIQKRIKSNTLTVTALIFTRKNMDTMKKAKIHQ